MSAPVLIVYNPAAGKRRGAVFAEELAGELRAAGAEVELLETRADRNVLAGLDASAYSRLVVIGGDGSFNEAINGLEPDGPPVAFGGTGTVNVLGSELGLPRDAGELARSVLAARTARLPLLRANQRRFLLFTEAGVLGDVVRAVNEKRACSSRHGKLEFVLAALKLLPRAWGRKLEVTIERVDGREVRRRYSNVLVTRARNYGGTIPVPLTSTDDPPLERPSFEVIGCGARTPFGHLFLLALGNLRLLPFFRGLLHRLGWMEFHHARRVRIEGPAETGVHADAETWPGPDGLALPVEVAAEGGSVPLILA